MHQIEELKETARELSDGLRQLGANRVVALSVHVTRALIAELEEQAARLVAGLDELE